MNLNAHFVSIRRRWRTVLVGICLVVGAAALVSMMTPERFTSSAKVYVSTSGAISVTEMAQGGSFAQKQMQTYADLVGTSSVLQPVIDDVGMSEKPSELSRRISVDVLPDTVLLRISVTDSSPDNAANIANKVAKQLTVTVTQLEADGASKAAVRAAVVQPGEVPTKPSVPDLVTNLTLGFVLGLLIGVGTAVLADVLDRTVKDAENVTELTKVPVIGSIPEDEDAKESPVMLIGHRSNLRSEAFKQMRTNLRYFNNEDDEHRVLVITSAQSSEGKSSVAGQLALELASDGKTVCVLECDLRRPRLMQYFGLRRPSGASDVLVGSAQLSEVLYELQPNMYVIGAGTIPPNPAELLGSDRMDHLLANLREKFDYVLIDTPPVIPVTDAVLISGKADGVLLVTCAGKTRRDELKSALSILGSVRVLGVVVNRNPSSSGSRGGYSAYVSSEKAPTKKTGLGTIGDRLGAILKMER